MKTHIKAFFLSALFMLGGLAVSAAITWPATPTGESPNGRLMQYLQFIKGATEAEDKFIIRKPVAVEIADGQSALVTLGVGATLDAGSAVETIVADCAEGGTGDCKAATKKAVDATLLSAENIAEGVSLGGITGTHAAQLPNCTANEEEGCTTVATYQAFAPTSDIDATLTYGQVKTVALGGYSTAFNITAPADRADCAEGGTGNCKASTRVAGTDRAGTTASTGISLAGAGELLVKAVQGFYDGTNDFLKITDLDFIAANIKNGINLFGLTGTHEGGLALPDVYTANIEYCGDSVVQADKEWSDSGVVAGDYICERVPEIEVKSEACVDVATCTMGGEYITTVTLLNPSVVELTAVTLSLQDAVGEGITTNLNACNGTTLNTGTTSCVFEYTTAGDARSVSYDFIYTAPDTKTADIAALGVITVDPAIGVGGVATHNAYIILVLDVDDVFSTYLYTGNGTTQTITNGIDLAGSGGMVWIKQRSSTESHRVCSTAGYAYSFGLAQQTNTTTRTMDGTLQTFNSDGFYLNGTTYGNTGYNTNTATYVAWSFRNAPNFYYHDTVVKSAGSNATYNFSMHTAGLGMVRVQRIDAAGSWYIWHRSLTAGKLLIETTAAEATLGHITVSGTTVTLVNGVIADGDYLVEAWAHDTSADGIIQAGSYVGNGSADGPTITLGREPQYLMTKSSGGIGNWYTYDSIMGMTASGVFDNELSPSTLSAEYAGRESIDLTPTGFKLSTTNPESNANGVTHIYMAIRRPNKVPTSGTEVYNAIARTGTGAAATVTGVGFAPDLYMTRPKSLDSTPHTYDRLRGGGRAIETTSTLSEYSNSANRFDSMNGIILNGTTDNSSSSYVWIDHFFSRATGFFDIVAYTVSGVISDSAEPHNLGVAPELIIIKDRNKSESWWVGSVQHLGYNKWLTLNTSNAAGLSGATVFYSSDTTFGIDSSGLGMTTFNSAVAYLFATLPGISKVGSYTGNGTSQTIDAGFATTARFILIKRTDSTGDWFVWDSVRGIVAANDPHLSLNTTAAEVTTDDTIDPAASGFIVNQNTATNINVSGGTYIFLAIN